MEREAGTDIQNAIVAAAGPAFNFFLAWILWSLCPDIAVPNLLAGAFNLLPLRGSDGTNIVHHLMKAMKSPANLL